MRGTLSARKGFSLVEILVFVAVFSSVFTIILGIISYSGLALKNAEYRTFASHYADELVQWMRYQRDNIGYTALQSAAGTYCFNDTNISDTWPSPGDCASSADEFGLNNFYKREMTFFGDVNQLVVQVEVTWDYLGSTRSSEIEFYLTNRD